MYGMESLIAHETSVLEAGIDFSSGTLCPLSLSKFITRNFHTGGNDSLFEPIPHEKSVLSA
jgi:hypothetical protein